MPPDVPVTVAVVAANETLPETSQSPAVKLMLVILVPVAVVKLTALPEATNDETYAPMLPAAASSFVVVPMIPVENVALPSNLEVPLTSNLNPAFVNVPAFCNNKLPSLNILILSLPFIFHVNTEFEVEPRNWTSFGDVAFVLPYVLIVSPLSFDIT